MNDRLLIIMCKYPEPGRVKTRLGFTIGMDKAAIICKTLLDDLLESIGDWGNEIVIIDSQKNTIRKFSELYPNITIKHIPGDELRGPNSLLLNSFNYYCKKYRRVVMINADTVFATTELIDEAFDRLEDYDVVLGPCINGGIYLIGMKKAVDLFSILIAGPNPIYYEQTIRIIESHKLSYTLLTGLSDLDVLEDIRSINWNSDSSWRNTKKALKELCLINLSFDNN